MKLRWFATVNKYGLKTQSVLQYWDTDYKCWIDIPYFECKAEQEKECLTDESAY